MYTVGKENGVNATAAMMSSEQQSSKQHPQHPIAVDNTDNNADLEAAFLAKIPKKTPPRPGHDGHSTISKLANPSDGVNLARFTSHGNVGRSTLWLSRYWVKANYWRVGWNISYGGRLKFRPICVIGIFWGCMVISMIIRIFISFWNIRRVERWVFVWDAL